MSQRLLSVVVLSLLMSVIVSAGSLAGCRGPEEASEAGQPEPAAVREPDARELRDGDQAWFPRAQGLLDELKALAQAFPDREPASWKEVLALDQNGFAEWNPVELGRRTDEAERVLWKLWIVTGKPPFRRKARTRRRWLERNAETYASYIQRHRNIDSLELHTMGLASAAETCATDLWLPALRYVEEVTGLSLSDAVMVRVVPGRGGPLATSVLPPLNGRSSWQLAEAIRKWARINDEHMTWSEEKRMLVPTRGDFRGTRRLEREVDSILLSDP